MRLAILSDVHANLEALDATLGDIAARRVDRILCLGDIVGYNADPAACIALLRDAGALCIAGNHDRAVAGLITTEEFSKTASRAVAWTRTRLDPGDLAFLAGLPLQASLGDSVLAVHGILRPDGTGCEKTYLVGDERRRQCFAALAAHPSRARICAFGHTHRLEVVEFRDGRVQALGGDEILLRDNAGYLVNPGSVGEPRTADRRATYLVLDTARGVVTVHRVPYAFSVSLAKTREAGLAPRPRLIPAPVRATLRWGMRTFGLSGAFGRMGHRHSRAGGEAASSAQTCALPLLGTAPEAGVAPVSQAAEAIMEPRKR